MECGRVAPDHHVPERHRAGTAAQGDAPSQERLEQTAVRFQHAVDDVHTRAGSEGDAHEDETQCGARQCPTVRECAHGGIASNAP
jgi:hypothetical protein